MAKSKMAKVAPGANKFLIALYIRVSTDRQAEEGYSIEIQKERLEAYTKTFDGEVRFELYIDDGFSGASLERPAMRRLIDDCSKGSLTHVCVYKLDRLSRSQKDTLHLIEDVFLPNNIAFISVQESFNTATAFGRAVVGILSVFAQLERENIYERTRSGMQKRVEAGFWPGGGGTPFGYDYDKQQGILVPNADAEKVRRVYELYLQGFSLQVIADMLGLKYEKLAAQILSRKTNIGLIEYNGVEYRGRHEPIVTPETFERAMALKALRSEKRLVTTTPHLLSGWIRCGVCGAKMRYLKWGKAGFKLVCYSRLQSKPYLVHDPDCNNESVWADEVEKTVIEDVFAFTSSEISPGSASSRSKSPQELLENSRAELKTRLRRLYDLYSRDGNELLLSTIRDLTQELQTVETRLEREKESSKGARQAQEVRQALLNVRSTWPFMAEHEKRLLLASVITGITITHFSVRIDYKL
ncbi:MAG: recombinase family protein [Oscillospiraceae bacterium]|jgi:site-specific DNA recombinase|nr:recombinase family protein [Oscillospiraceae bacterium]